MHSETDLAVVPLLNLCPPGATEAIAVDVNGVDQLDEQGKETEDEGGNAEKAAGYALSGEPNTVEVSCICNN